MARWDPDARGRLERAALELFAEHGFAETTVPQITARAGLTTRTFFRHFTDKREVLFADEDELRDRLAQLILDAPAGLSPIGVMEHALDAAADTVFEPRRAPMRQWRAIVAGDEGLRERGLRKQELMVDAAVSALQERGVDPRSADMLARAAILVFETAVGDWLAHDGDEPLSRYVHDTLERLRGAITHE